MKNKNTQTTGSIQGEKKPIKRRLYIDEEQKYTNRRLYTGRKKPTKRRLYINEEQKYTNHRLYTGRKKTHKAQALYR